jgi:hypothetical protein
VAELPETLTCSVSGAGKDEAKKLEIAESFISNAIKYTASKRKRDDYELKIENNTARFILK